MGVPPICPLEHGCPFTPRRWVSLWHPYGHPRIWVSFRPNTRTWVSFRPNKHGCPHHRHPCASASTKVGVPSTPPEHGCPHRDPTWVSSTGPRTWVSSTGPEHGCPFGQQIWVSPRRRRWVSFPHRPFRTDRGVSQRSTNMGVPWHPSVSPGTHRFGLFFSAGGCPWRRRIFPQPLGGGSA